MGNSTDVTVKTKLHQQKEKKKYKRVLILGGGGVKGAFQIGTIKHLIEKHDIKWDLIIGVSVGALTGSYLAMYNQNEVLKGIKSLESFWRTKINNEAIYKPIAPGFWKYAFAFFTKYINSTEPLRKTLTENWDLKKLKRSDVDFLLGTTSLLSGQYRNVDKYSDGIIDWIMASSAFPILFPSIKILNDEYIDGGLRSNVPINDALQFDVEHIDVILCEPYGDHAKSLKRNKNLIDVILRTTEILSDELFVNDLKHICFFHDIDIDIYSPMSYLTSETLDFNPKLINEMIDIGYTSRRKVSVKKGSFQRISDHNEKEQKYTKNFEDREGNTISSKTTFRAVGTTGRTSIPPGESSDITVTDSIGFITATTNKEHKD